MSCLERASAPLLVALLCSCGGSAPDDVKPTDDALSAIVATCSARGGDVQVKRRDEGFWSDAQVATVLRAGDWVKTGAGASARVELLSGGALEMGENASLVLEEGDNGSSTGTMPRVAVREGSVTAKLGAGDVSGLNLKLEDGSEANLTANGAEPLELRLSHGEHGTEIDVSAGEATIQSGEDSRVLKRGAVAALGHGKVSDLKLLPAPDPQLPLAESLVQAGVDAQLSWTSVSTAKGYRVQLARDPQFTVNPMSFNSADHRTRRSFSTPGPYYWRVATVDAGGHTGPYGKVLRFFVTTGPPTDQLTLPEDGAIYGFVDAPPKLSFHWRPVSGEATYVLVIGWGPDLLNQRLSSRQVHDANTTVKGLTKGQYYWGVYRGEEGEPIFTHPRRLLVVKNARAVLKTPQRIEKWGN